MTDLDKYLDGARRCASSATHCLEAVDGDATVSVDVDGEWMEVSVSLLGLRTSRRIWLKPQVNVSDFGWNDACIAISDAYNDLEDMEARMAYARMVIRKFRSHSG